MMIENHKEEVPFAHYAARFSELDPQEAVGRLSFARFDGEAFFLTLLGREYRIAWPEYAISAFDGQSLPPLPTQTFLLRLLLEGRDEPWAGTWKTFREMPWGEMYNTPYTGRVLKRSAFTFGTRLEGFRRAAQKLGGIPLPHGDAGYQFTLLGGYQMQLLVWEGDDEFPPNAQILYSDNFTAFAAEDRVVAGDILITHLKNAM